MDAQQQLQDAGNPLLAPQPYRLDFGMVTGEDGTVRGVVTRRTASTSFTLYPTAEQLREEAKLLNAQADKIDQSGSKLVAPHPAVIQQLQQKLNGRPR
jgi:hypothetical protein